MSGTGNSTQLVFLSGDPFIDGLIRGSAWADSSITYAFPDSADVYDYSGGVYATEGFDDFPANFLAVTEQQKLATEFALDAGVDAFGNYLPDAGFSVEGFTNLEISETTEDKAEIRLARSSSSDVSTALAFYPIVNSSAEDASGDVWFGTSYDNIPNVAFTDPTPGTYPWHGHIHEIGHALGLKHGHEANTAPPTETEVTNAAPPSFYGSLYFEHFDYEPGAEEAASPAVYDSMEYSVMTYRSYIGDPLEGGYSNGTFYYAQTWMMADIAALQYIYGADYTTNSDDTVYSWFQQSSSTFVNGSAAIKQVGTNNNIFATIWDGGGIDTYDLSSYFVPVNIDLTPGGHSYFSLSQIANLGDGNFARGNIFNALLFEGNTASLIENAIGGSGGDTLTGNVANNHLTGNAGADSLKGLDGDDILEGGVGTDEALYEGASTDFTIQFNADGTHTVTENNSSDGLDEGTDSLSGIETLFFAADGARVSLVNVAPVANEDLLETNEDTPVDGNVLTNDTDINGDQLTVTAINGLASNVGTTMTLQSGATFTLTEDGTLSYDPNDQFESLDDGEFSRDFFGYTISDGKGGESSSLVYVTVNGVTDVAPTPELFIGIYDADTDELITELSDGAVISPDLIGDGPVTISATVPSDYPDSVESIRLNLNNGTYSRVESVAPYALFGDKNGDYRGKSSLFNEGQNTATLELFDNNSAKGNLLETISLTFTVADDVINPTPSLALSINPETVAEGDGLATGTVTRDGDTSAALTVSLSSNDTSEATVASTVEIAAGQSSASFDINIEDDNIVDGTQTATISVNASGYDGDTANLNVTDNDEVQPLPTLTVSIDPNAVTEGDDPATGTITRTGDLSAALTVSLSSSDPSEASVDATVTIPENQASVDFDITIIDDTIVDGTQSTTISAESSGYESGTATLSVADNDQVTSPTNDLIIALFDAQTDTQIAELTNGTEIQASDIADRQLTIAAIVPDDSFYFGDVKSMSLDLNEGDYTRIENVAPYALFGDKSGDYRGKTDILDLGENNVEFALYDATKLNGDLLATISIDFSVVDDIA